MEFLYIVVQSQGRVSEATRYADGQNVNATTNPKSLNPNTTNPKHPHIGTLLDN